MVSWRTLVPAPLRALRWRLPWVRSTASYAQAPLRTWLRAARFTVSELAGGDMVFRSPDGLAFASMPNNFTSFALFVDGVRDPIIWRFIRRHLRAGDTFIDAGANIGAYSMPAARLVGPAGRVIAFEAHPVTYGYLKRGVEMNALSQVTPLNLALGAAAGTVAMTFVTANPGETHISSAAEVRGTHEVPLVPLDAALAERGIKQINYLKIDVEGFELPVLQGARGIIAASPDIAVQTELEEQHAHRYGHSVAEIAALLRDLGLQPHGVDMTGNLYPLEDELTCDVIWTRRTSKRPGSEM